MVLNVTLDLFELINADVRTTYSTTGVANQPQLKDQGGLAEEAVYDER